MRSEVAWAARRVWASLGEAENHIGVARFGAARSPPYMLRRV